MPRPLRVMQSFVVLLCCAGAGLAGPPTAPSAATAPAGPGIDLAGMDRTVAPGDDFFAYANGSWVRGTEIPGDRPALGAMGIVAESTAGRVADLIRQASRQNPPAGSEARKVGDFYDTYMDEAAIESRGMTPLKPELERIAAIADRKALAQELGRTLSADVDAINNTDFYTPHLFGLWVAQDLSDPSRYVPFLLQGGLDMPERSYYLDPSPRMAEVRTRFQAHVANVLKLAGAEGAETRAQKVADLERRLAGAHWSRAENENLKKANNHWKREDFARQAPGLDWAEYFAAAGLGDQPEFVVWQPSALVGLSALVGDQPLDTWKDWLTFHAVEGAAAVLPKAVADESFAFHGQVLLGTQKQRDRWKRAVTATDQALGEAVGRLYVERYFPAAEKARAEEMVRNLIVAFSRRIDALDWMTPETKARAKAKLAVLKVGVGYPDHWHDYSGLEVVRGDAFGNAERAERFAYRHQLAKLGQPVDRGEWVMTPQTVNAVNLPAMNALNFPAAILQPPFFDPRRPALMDYGAIGSVIGHEVSHSFDDQGALFDAQGKLENWWTPADFAHFEKSGDRLAAQFDQYRPFPDVAVHGKQTLSENIADVAGLAAAYDAYRISLGGKEPAPVDGLTGDQQFFVAFAQSWRNKSRDGFLRQQVLTDGHAPAMYRAQTVRNLDAWYAAFDVKPGQKLYLAPADRVRVW